MRRIGHVACMGREDRCVQDFVGETWRIDHFEHPAVGGKIILKWIFRQWDVGTWTTSIWLMIGTGDGHLWMR